MITGWKKCNAVGLTSVLDPGISAGDARMYQELFAAGEMYRIRTSAMLSAGTEAAINTFSTYYYQGFGNDWLKFDSLKRSQDGGIEAGYMREPYLIVPGEQDDPNYRGVIRLTEEELIAYSLAGAKKGWRIGIHHVGDAAIDRLLNAWEAVDQQIPIKDKRWTLIHAIVCAPDQYSRIKNLGLCITSQNQMYSHGGIVGAMWWGLERAAAASPHRDWIDAGIIVGGGTDYQVAPYNPWESIYWMVSRVTATYGLLGPEQAVSREEALWMYTMGSAYCMKWEDKIGSIEPGKLADLVVLNKNYLHCKVDDIQNMAGNVVMTIVGGKIVYEKP
jgi:predicted amidohydrolase YtcJ